MHKQLLIASVIMLNLSVLTFLLYRQYHNPFSKFSREFEMKPSATTSAGSSAATQIAESPFACDTTAMDAEGRKRHALVTQQIKNSVMEIRELPDGYKVRFTPSQESIMLIAEFIAREKLCCPFFNLELVTERERGPVWLQLRGREGVKTFIQTEFKFKG